MGFLAGVLGGVGQAAAEDRRKRFDANERERIAAIESLNKILLDPDTTNEEKQAAATQLQAGHAAPIGKRATWYNPSKIFVPPAPPTAEQQLAMVRGQQAPPTAPPQTVNAPLTLGANTGDARTIPGVYAIPPPPPGVSAPGNAPPATSSTVATPQPPPGMAGSTETMTGQPQEIPSFANTPRLRNAWAASQLEVQAERGKRQQREQDVKNSPAFQKMSQEHQQAYIWAGEEGLKNPHLFETAKQELTEQLGHEPTDVQLERALKIAPPFASMRINPGDLTPDPNSTTGWSRLLRNALGDVVGQIPNVAPPASQVPSTTDITPTALGGSHQVKRPLSPSGATPATSGGVAPRGGGTPKGAVGGKGTVAMDATLRSGIVPDTPDPAWGLSPGDTALYMEAAASHNLGQRPTGKTKDLVTAFMGKHGISQNPPIGGQAQSRAAAARSIMPLIDDVENKLRTNPGLAAQLGPASGRWSDVQKKLGNLSPEARELAGELISIYSFAGTMHGWRALAVASEFQKVYGGLEATPESLLGGMQAMRRTADAVQAATRYGAVQTPSPPPGGGQHVIELNGKQYRYNGSGDTADLKNYTEVKK